MIKNISILNFQATGVSQAEANTIYELFSVKMVMLGEYNILDRANMERILAEQEFQKLGCTETECAVEIGRILNMHYMITGTVTKIQEK